jgi:hypothetical protein
MSWRTRACSMLRTHSPNTRLTPKIRVYGVQALPSADAAGHADVPSTTRRLRFSDAASQSAI